LNHFVERLAARALGLPPAIRPRLRALFEPVGGRGEADISASHEGDAPPSVDRTGRMSSEHDVDAVRPSSGAGARGSPGKPASDVAASGAVASAAPPTPPARPHRTLEPFPVAGMLAEPQSPGPAAAPAGEIFLEANQSAGDRPPPRALLPAAGQAAWPEPPDPFRAFEPDHRTRTRPPRPLIDIVTARASPDAPSHPIGPPAWADEGQAGPEIKITIGCIDVRAMTDAKPKPSAVREAARRRPAFISLENYLKRGARGGS
jgi:hypothetical protein